MSSKKIDKRTHRHKAHYGLSDYRKFYKKKYNHDIDTHLYRNIIEDFNKAIVNLIIEENLEYSLPYIYMEVSIKKEKRGPILKDGKLYNNTPIDWKATKDLWQRDSEAAEKKLTVKYNNYHTGGYVFSIYLKKFRCKLRCRSYYKLKANRKFQRAIAKRINDENKDPFDAYLLKNYKKK